MAGTSARPPAEAGRAAGEASFYHESDLNSAWAGSRLAIASLSFLFGSFLFAYFYLRSLNSAGRWLGSGYHPPSIITGSFITMMVVISAAVHYGGLQQIKAGHKHRWQILGLIALVTGLGAVALQLTQLLYLPFWPGSSGYSSVFVAFYPVFIVVLLAGLFWLETLLARSRGIPAISLVRQPSTFAAACEVQRFQASLSAFTLVWNYLALVGVLFWALFYVIP